VTLALSIASLLVTVWIGRSTDATARRLADQQEALNRPNLLRATLVEKHWLHGIHIDQGGGAVEWSEVDGCTTVVTSVANMGRADTSVTRVATLGGEELDSAWLDPTTGAITRITPQVVPAGQIRFVIVQVARQPSSAHPSSSECPLAPVEFTQLDGSTLRALAGTGQQQGLGDTLPGRLTAACPEGIGSCASRLPHG
jgi:hypothetical protein